MSYLRQPSPLSFEPLSPSPSDLVASDSERETDSDSRKAKRRRVEDLGRQYLAGRQLFIQSASLRGPFNNGWVNPWNKSREGGARHGSTNRDERQVVQRSTDRAVQSVAGDQLEDVSGVVARGHFGPNQQVSKCLDKASMTTSSLGLAAGPKRKAQEQLVLTKPEQRGWRQEERLCTPALPQQNRITRSVEPAVGLTGPLERPHLKQTPVSLISAANEWLKSDEGYLAEQPREEANSPTPTPTSRADYRRTPPGQYTDSRTPTPGRSREVPLVPSRPAGFTPINVPSRSLDLSYNQDAHKPKKLTSRSPSNAPATVKKRRLNSPKGKSTRAGAVRKDGGQCIELHLPSVTLNDSTEAAATIKISGVSPASRDPAPRPSTTEFSPVSVRGQNLTSPQHSALTTREPKSPTSYSPSKTMNGGVPVQHSHSRTPPFVLKKSSVNEHEFSHSPSDSRSKVQTVPPSTNMSAFKYRRPMKAIPGPRLESAEPSVEPSAFEARQIPKSRRLEFASSEDPPHRADAQTSTAQAISKGGPVHDVSSSQHCEDVSNPSCEELSVIPHSPDRQVLVQQTDEPSRVSSVFQEAQLVLDPAGKDTQAPSASSTNPMETDKQSLHFHTETDDASAHLSTQAAIAKAQLSFKAELASPIKQCSVPFPENEGRNGLNHSHFSSVKKPKHNITPFQTFRTPSPEVLYQQNPATSRPDEHLSTQQMIDAVTPFAFSTTKKAKAKKISFTTSGVDRQSHKVSDPVNMDHGDFGHSSLDMETSPDTSVEANERTRGPPRGRVLEKEVSSANSLALPVSFSIEPNGTLKEVFQQDGQVGDAPMDLGAVLDDVGSFLQSWDLEAELKKSTGPSTTGSTNPGSRVHKGIASGTKSISRP